MQILGLWPCTVEELLAGLVAGSASRLLGEVHIALLRLLQADMEEAHALGAVQVPHARPLVFPGVALPGPHSINSVRRSVSCS